MQLIMYDLSELPGLKPNHLLALLLCLSPLRRLVNAWFSCLTNFTFFSGLCE